jgi:hypothetical protein
MFIFSALCRGGGAIGGDCHGHFLDFKELGQVLWVTEFTLDRDQRGLLVGCLGEIVGGC